jgi:hypothetical protein
MNLDKFPPDYRIRDYLETDRAAVIAFGSRVIDWTTMNGVLGFHQVQPSCRRLLTRLVAIIQQLEVARLKISECNVGYGT